MPRPLGHIRILLSARVLFDLEEADKIFKEKGVKEYADYMRGRGAYEKDYVPELAGRKLGKGPLWDFAQALLALNKPGEEPVVELGLLCKDTAETALPIFRNLDVTALKGIGYRLSTAGGKLKDEDHAAFGTDLLLTRNAEDVQNAVDKGIAAAVINFPPAGSTYSRKPGGPVEICVDGDAVAVGSSSEVIYRKKGLEGYRRKEAQIFDKAMEDGPFTKFLAKVSALNAGFSPAEQPFRLKLLTARGNEAGAHMLAASEKLGIEYNGGFYFMSGASKATPLKAHAPDIYFDDQMVHLSESAAYCPTGLVAYPQGSPMHKYMRQLEQNKQDITAPAAEPKPAPAAKPASTRSPKP